jgi:hypothetical protein
MQQCEARYWIKRWKIKIGEVGLENAKYWWEGVKNDIKKRRGDQGLANLIRCMEAERNADKAAVSAERVDAEQQKRKTLGGNALGEEKIQRGLFLSD